LPDIRDAAWVNQVRLTFGKPPREGDDLEAPFKLAQLEGDNEIARALQFIGARRAQSQGQHQRTLRTLRELHEREPSDELTATYLACLLRDGGELGECASVLAACAEATVDSELAVALRLESAMMRWLAGNRQAARQELEQAAQLNEEATESLLAWATIAERPGDLNVRRSALTARAERSTDDVLSRLELFAVEAGSGGDSSRAHDVLAECPVDAAGELGRAVTLAHAIFTPRTATPDDTLAMRTAESRKSALEQIATWGKAGGVAALVSDFLAETGKDRSPEHQVESTERWAKSECSLSAHLSWLTAAIEHRRKRIKFHRWPYRYGALPGRW
jgi:hypothetical protein